MLYRDVGSYYVTPAKAGVHASDRRKSGRQMDRLIADVPTFATVEEWMPAVACPRTGHRPDPGAGMTVGVVVGIILTVSGIYLLFVAPREWVASLPHVILGLCVLGAILSSWRELKVFERV